jgi:hypothetical protein
VRCAQVHICELEKASIVALSPGAMSRDQDQERWYGKEKQALEGGEDPKVFVG